MRFIPILTAAALLTLASACHDTITPHVGATFNVHRGAAGVIVIAVDVHNDSAERATVPLLVEVRAFEEGTPTARTGVPVIHPVAFVLNRLESRKLTYQMDTNAGVLAQLTVKEAERGILLDSMTRTVDPVAPPAPAEEKKPE